MVDVWRYPMRSSSPAPLIRAASLTTSCSRLSPMHFLKFPTMLYGQPAPLSERLHGKKVLGFCICSSVILFHFLLSLGTIEESMSFLLPSSGIYLYTLIRSPWAFSSWAEQSQLSHRLLMCQIFQSLSDFHGPLLDSLQYVCACLVPRSPEHGKVKLNTQIYWQHY